MLLAYLHWFKKELDNDMQTRESDYSKIIALVLPEAFTINNGWCIVPEFTLEGNYSSDYLVSKINTDINSPFYGSSMHWLCAELKDRVAVSWWILLNDQLWSQCDAAKNNKGRFWCIGQIGF